MLAIVTDSAAYLTEAEARAMGVRVVPFSYNVDGIGYVESFADANGDYDSLIRAAKSVSTAPCSVAAYMSTFDELLRKGFDVLCITISTRLSGAYRNARKAAEGLSADRLLVLDSQTGAAPMEFIVRKARELADSDLGLAEIGTALEEFRRKCGICFSVDSIDSLRRSGRLATLRQSVGTILNIKPIMKVVNGAITFYSSAKGKTEQARKMTELIPAGAGEIILQHFGKPELIRFLEPAVRERFPGVPLKIKNGGPVLGIHLGIGCIVAAWLEK